MTDSSHDILTLNSLIATTIDSADGYREAAKASETGRFASLFVSRANERTTVATRLQQEVRTLGGTPDDDGTILASAHRVFVKLKALVTGNDDKAIISEVEAGEDHIKAKFEDAMRDMKLSASARSIIESSYASVKECHDEMRDLKHSMQD